MVYCETCGAANTVDAEFCFACQKSLTELPEPPAEPIVLKPEPTKNDDLLSSGNTLLQGRYRVLKQVGTGGFGAVYKASDVKAGNRNVAIKQINLKGLKPNEIIEATDTFNREVEILSDLGHTNLPRVYEHFTDPEHWYVVMDFIEGQTLEEYLLTTKGHLALDEILDIGIQLCSVLEYLHTRVPPIIFRDLKPANIMLTPYKQVYLIDFGTARFFKPGKPRDTIAFGSPGYAAPEQYGKAQTTPRSDIYSLGATLHHLLTGKDPADEPFRFTSLRSSNAALPAELDRLVMSMVEMEVKDRPSSASTVKTELQRISVEHGRRLYPLPGTLPFYQPGANRARTPGITPGTGWIPATSYSGSTAQGSGQSQLQAQLGVPSQGAGGSQSASPKKGNVSRRAVVGGLIALSVLGPRLINDLTKDQQPADSYPGPPHQRNNYPQDIYTVRQSYQYPGAVTAVQWSNATVATNIAVCDAGGNIDVLDTSGTSLFHYQDNNKVGSFSALTWKPDGQHLAAIGDNGEIVIASSASNQFTSSIFNSGYVNMRTIAWSPDGNRFALGGAGNTVYIVSANDPTKVLASYTGHTAPITSLDWSPDGKTIASASNDATVQVWSPDVLVNHLDPNRYSYTNHSQAVNAVKWSLDGVYIASASLDQTVRVWQPFINNVTTMIYRQHTESVTSLAWSPDSSMIASGSTDQTVQIWDSKSGDQKYIFHGHKEIVDTISWQNNQGQNVLASGDSSGLLTIWSPDDAR